MICVPALFIISSSICSYHSTFSSKTTSNSLFLSPHHHTHTFCTCRVCVHVCVENCVEICISYSFTRSCVCVCVCVCVCACVCVSLGQCHNILFSHILIPTRTLTRFLVIKQMPHHLCNETYRANGAHTAIPRTLTASLRVKVCVGVSCWRAAVGREIVFFPDTAKDFKSEEDEGDKVKDDKEDEPEIVSIFGCVCVCMCMRERQR